MIQIHSDLLDLIKLLNAARAKYLLVGGYAVAFHGYNRPTLDFDLWVRIDEKNADRIVHVLKEFGFGVPNLSAKLFLKKDSLVTLGVPPLEIQFHTTLSGVDFDDCWKCRLRRRIQDVPVNFINLKMLRINKAASGRLKDLADLESLPPK